jgi:adenine-specific DNA-methyltransferase
MQKWIEEKRVFFGQKGTGAPQLKRYLKEVQDGVLATSWWTHEECGHNDESRKESKIIFGNLPFSTPKPERLIERILFLATDENDIVLDSFLGSATTSAVAHKMKRRWIGIELGEHANTHCLPRLKKVVDGEQGGISQSVNWTGGGGFKFYNLAPSLLKQDEYGNWVIDPQYNPDMLAAAMTKQEGFHYSPDESIYWKQGKSSEKDFIFTTTRFVTVEMLDKLHDEMQPDESLLVCCKSFKKECQNRHANISIKKIPQMLLGRCEFGKEDYSLNIVNLPHDEESEGIEESVQGIETVKVAVEKKKKGKKTNPGNNLELF